MNNKDYKRYKKLRADIAQLHQDVDDTMSAIRLCYEKRDVQGARELELDLNILLEELYKRETIKSELLLPKYLKIENGFQEVKDFIKNNNYDEEDTGVFLEEYCSMFMLDNYNHNHYDFYYHVKDNDIYITNIRWNEKQMLPHDLKRVLKGEIKDIKNGYVLIKRHPIYKNQLSVYEKGSQMSHMLSFKETVEYLESRNYM